MLAIIDYGSGNLRSCAKAFERVARVGNPVRVTSVANVLDDATHIVLPGVGAFGDCMQGLAAIPGMIDALTRNVIEKKKPFLGICVGMQMLFTEGHEHGVHKGLGWIEGKVEKLARGTLKIPHMGWNDLAIGALQHKLLTGIKTGDHAYFVHSYHAVCATADSILATTDYGGNVAAIVGRGNIMGTQFHPEKSQGVGLRLLENFLQL